MVEVKFGLRTVDLPYTIRLYGVTDEMFDEMVDEDTKADLIDGVMIVHSPASPRHDNIAGFIRTLMRCYAEDQQLGLVLGPDSLIRFRRGRRCGPDVFYLEASRAPHPLPKEFTVVPHLILEVLSPSNRDDDLDEKRPVYRAAGVREIWFVDYEEEQILVDRRRGKRYSTDVISTGEVSSRALAGFRLETSWLWSDPLPNVMQCLRHLLA
jgi:Uma2 family endonuclease